MGADRFGLAALAVALVSCLGAAPLAHADAGVITLVEPAGGRVEGPLGEARARLAGELAAEGYRVERVTAPVDATGRALVDPSRAAAGARAIVALAAGSPPILWIHDRTTGRVFTTELKAGVTSPELLSLAITLRAVECIRVVLQSPLAPAPRPGPAAIIVSTADTARSRIGLAVGVAALGLGGMSAAPFLSLSFDVSRRLSLRAQGIGPTVLVPTVSADVGRSEVQASAGLAELVVALLPRERRWVPYLVGGAGALRIEARGKAAAPFEGISSERWAGVAAFGAGLAFGLGDILRITAEVSALTAQPAVVVDIGAASAARIGRPLFVGAVGVSIAL